MAELGPGSAPPFWSVCLEELGLLRECLRGPDVPAWLVMRAVTFLTLASASSSSSETVGVID